MDFASLTPAEQDALTGHEREAWYAWRRGDHDKVEEILAAYPAREPEPAPEPFGNPDDNSVVDVKREPPPDKPASRRPGRPRPPADLNSSFDPDPAVEAPDANSAEEDLEPDVEPEPAPKGRGRR